MAKYIKTEEGYKTLEEIGAVTAYTEFKRYKLIEKQSVSVPEYGCEELVTETVMPTKGATYFVTLNRTQYECVAWWNHNWGCIVIGNGSLADMEGMGEDVPFVIDFYCEDNYTYAYLNADGGEYTISIDGLEPIHKLDKKYLPDSVINSIDNAQTMAETAQSTADGKMDANNPVGTGSFSMGRANGSAVGENSFAFGNDTMATALNAISNGEGAVANFRNMKASGAYNKYDSYYEEIIASQEYSLPKGYYTAIGTTYSVSENGYVLEGTVSTMVQLGDVPVGSYVITKWTFNESSGNQTTGTTMYYVLSNVAYSTNSRLLTVDKYTLSLADADTKGKYVHIVGNGTSDTERSNAHTLDWNGNAWYAGDVYVGSTSGTNRDEGSKKLATEDKVTELAIKTPEEASVGQTIVVKEVDENGKPTAWEASDFPKEVWEKINEITVDEVVDAVEITTDHDGNPFSLKKMYIFLTLPKYDYDGATGTGYSSFTINGYNELTSPSSGWENKELHWTIEAHGNHVVSDFIVHDYNGAWKNFCHKVFWRREDETFYESIHSIKWALFAKKVLAGTKIEIYGVRA